MAYVSSEVALVYNDRAVLENFHVSAVFRLFRDDDFNILTGLRTDEYRYVAVMQQCASTCVNLLPYGQRRVDMSPSKYWAEDVFVPQSTEMVT